jgi:hypothetical protein
MKPNNINQVIASMFNNGNAHIPENMSVLLWIPEQSQFHVESLRDNITRTQQRVLASGSEFTGPGNCILGFYESESEAMDAIPEWAKLLRVDFDGMYWQPVKP